MTLKRLVNKKSLNIIGLNSGTSADGVDLSAIRYSPRGRQAEITYVAGTHRTYTTSIRTAVLKASCAELLAPEELMSLDNELGRFYGSAAAAFVKKLSREKFTVDALASHGQTVRHRPAAPRTYGRRTNSTLQLGSLEHIATATGKVVVGDFRQADIAIGHEGAPITVAAMAQLFRSRTEPRLIVNIGGIANFFYLPAGSGFDKVRAGDCGPGNSLLDLLSSRLYGEPYDHHGRRAETGNVSEPLLRQLMSHPFFRSHTVSTGREVFGFGLVKKILSVGKRRSLKREDLIATAAEFTAGAIAHKIEPFFKRDRRLAKLYLTGGGEKNTFVKKRLAEHLPGITPVSIAELGIDPRYVEATAYAVMGAATLFGRPVRTVFVDNRPQTVQPVPGKIVQPPVKVKR